MKNYQIKSCDVTKKSTQTAALFGLEVVSLNHLLDTNTMIHKKYFLLLFLAENE